MPYISDQNTISHSAHPSPPHADKPAAQAPNPSSETPQDSFYKFSWDSILPVAWTPDDHGMSACAGRQHPLDTGSARRRGIQVRRLSGRPPWPVALLR
jgi:hypothetical protein